MLNDKNITSDFEIEILIVLLLMNNFFKYEVDVGLNFNVLNKFKFVKLVLSNLIGDDSSKLKESGNFSSFWEKERREKK